MAGRMGMSSRYGRQIWLIGTTLAWPIGLFVLATGKLLLISPQALAAPCGDACADNRAQTGDRRDQPVSNSVSHSFGFMGTAVHSRDDRAWSGGEEGLIADSVFLPRRTKAEASLDHVSQTSAHTGLNHRRDP